MKPPRSSPRLRAPRPTHQPDQSCRARWADPRPPPEPRPMRPVPPLSRRRSRRCRAVSTPPVQSVRPDPTRQQSADRWLPGSRAPAPRTCPRVPYQRLRTLRSPARTQRAMLRLRPTGDGRRTDPIDTVNATLFFLLGDPSANRRGAARPAEVCLVVAMSAHGQTVTDSGVAVFAPQNDRGPPRRRSRLCGSWREPPL